MGSAVIRRSASQLQSRQTPPAAVWDVDHVRDRWELMLGVAYVVQHTKDHDNPSELDVDAGDVVRVESIQGDGWIEVKSLTHSRRGVIPPSVLFNPSLRFPEPAPPNMRRLSMRGRPPPPTPGKVGKGEGVKVDVVKYGWWGGSVYYAQRRYDAIDRPPDEIPVTPADMMLLDEVEDENWLLGRNLTTGSSGLFPASVLFGSEESSDAVAAV
ncbi:hypothetical protein HDU93_008027 [Gonapodya sp. JEL0774]|nr:hypothetical protein HDU93_008027 [Gonapodya sp. JEL0774]